MHLHHTFDVIGKRKMEFGNRASIIRWPKPNRKQQTQARAIVLLDLLTATALPHVRSVVVEALHRRLAACRHAPCGCLACVTPLIARPSVAADHHERDGLAAGQRPCPMLCCARGRRRWIRRARGDGRARRSGERLLAGQSGVHLGACRPNEQEAGELGRGGAPERAPELQCRSHPCSP